MMPEANTVKVLLVHPDDMNLARVETLAAEHGVPAEASYYAPRGQAFVADASGWRYEPLESATGPRP